MGVGLMISILLVLTAPREDFVTSMAQATTTVAQTTTTGGTTATVSPKTIMSTTGESSSPSVTLKVTLEEPFVEEFTDRTSPRFRTLEEKTIQTCNSIYIDRFGFLFIRALVIGFSPATANCITSNTAAEVRLDFNSTVRIALLPAIDEVERALVEAASNPNITLDVTILIGSVQVVGSTFPGATTPAGSTATGRTTAAVSTATSLPSTATTEAPPPSVGLEVILGVVFVQELTNRSSEEFKSLESTVITVCDRIYIDQFGSRFMETVVEGFSPAPGNGSTNNTAAEVSLVFNASVPLAQLPTPAEVVQTLVDAVTDPDSTFNVSILANSTQLLGSTFPGATTPAGSAATGASTATGTTTGSTFPGATTPAGSAATGASPAATGTTTAAVNTATSLPSTTTTEAPPPSVDLRVILVVVFVQELTNRSSEEFRSLESTIVTVCDRIYIDQFGSRFMETVVEGFSPAPGNGSTNNTAAEVTLVFNASVPLAQLPTPAEVVQTLVDAVTDPDSTFNVSILANSTQLLGSTIPGPTTTTTQMSTTNGRTTSDVSTSRTTTAAAASATTGATNTTTVGSTTTAASTATRGTTAAVTTTTISTTTEVPAPVAVLEATLEEPFVEEYNDRNSELYRRLETVVVTACNSIYFAQFRFLFLRSFVIGFRSVALLTRTNVTAAQVGLEFNRSATPAELPTSAAIVETFVSAVSTPNNTFNLSVQIDSVQVLQSNLTNSTTTSPGVNVTTAASSAATTASNASTTASNASTTASNASTTASNASTTASSAAATTPTEALVTRQLSFRSVGETFTTDLLNSSSEAFTRRASLITSTLTPLYQQFPSFRSFNVTSFSNGSIINNATLRFASTSVPNNTAIGNVLINAASNITAFNIDTSSIFVENTEVSSGVSHKISLVTASCLVLLSWLLSFQQ